MIIQIQRQNAILLIDTIRSFLDKEREKGLIPSLIKLNPNYRAKFLDEKPRTIFGIRCIEDSSIKTFCFKYPYGYR